MTIFKNILKFLGIAESTAKVELSEEQKEKIDTALGELDSIKTERDTLKTKVTGLETAAGTSAARITELEGTVATMTTDKTTQDAEVVKLNAEVTRLGKLDAGKFTQTAADKEKVTTEEVIEMSASQKELNEKMKNI